MSELQLRTITTPERDAVLDLLGEWLHDRAFFARYFDHDPSFRDELCFVAWADKRPVSTLQVFRKQVRTGDAVLQVGCVGNVFTTAEYRERRLASQLLQHAITAMQQHGFDISLLFAVRLKFYGALGWRSHVRHLIFLEPAALQAQGTYRLQRFEEGDLPAVTRVYDAYSGNLSGTTVRDEGYWRGQLRYAGNPNEDFVVARADEQIVAYARGTGLYDFYVIMEHGYLPGHADALTQLVVHLHGGAGVSWPGTITQLATEPGVQDALRQQGLALRQVEDVFWMWRPINADSLAAKLRLHPEDVHAEDFLSRILPPERSVYWLADRF